MGGFSDWGLSTSTSYPGSFDFGGLDDFIDPFSWLDNDSGLGVEVVGAGIPAIYSYTSPFADEDWLVNSLLSEGRIPQVGFNIPAAGQAILFEDLPYITENFYGPDSDAAIPGQLGGFNPDVGPIGFNFKQSPGTWLDYYGFGAGDLLPGYFTDTEPFGGAHTTVGGEDEVLGPSGRPKINTTPGGGSTANTNTGGPALPGTPGGESVRDPSDNVPGGDSDDDDDDDDGGGDGGGGGGGGIDLGGIGGLAASALGLALLREFLDLFDRDESTYRGIDMPTVRDITAPQTPQIAPAQVVPYETYAPQSRPVTRFSEAPIEGLGRAEGGLATALRPHMLAVGGRADYREGAPVVGKGTGQSDDIPALLSDGEYVIDADTVAALGDGSNKAGAKVLDEFRELIRQHKRAAPADKIPPKAKSPLAYLKEAKKNG